MEAAPLLVILHMRQLLQLSATSCQHKLALCKCAVASSLKWATNTRLAFIQTVAHGATEEQARDTIRQTHCHL
jgi:hypothetical protein